ncbi:hypothetical protein BJX76DRAFT_361605 [Aspergillus varians]
MSTSMLELREDGNDRAWAEANTTNGEYSDWAVFLILRRCQETTDRDEGLSMEDAGKFLCQMIPNGDSGYGNALGEIILDIAEQTPYNHPSQAKLVRLIQWLMDTDRFFDDGRSAYTLGWPLERLRFYLGQEIGEPQEGLDKPEKISTAITSASLWFLCAGQWLFSELVLYPSYPDVKHPLGIEQWLYWKQTLNAKAQGGQIDDEARELALKAVDFMNALERSTSL